MRKVEYMAYQNKFVFHGIFTTGRKLFSILKHQVTPENVGIDLQLADILVIMDQKSILLPANTRVQVNPYMYIIICHRGI